jgi:hypothetical protein
MSNLTPRQQHDIRNAILQYKGLRHQIFTHMIAMAKCINAMDVEIKRINTAAFNGDLPPIEPWYKRIFKK